MKKIIFSLFLSVCLYSNIFSQNDKDSLKICRNTVYFELLGNAVDYSINYDRILFHAKYFQLAARVGLSYWANKKDSYHSITIPTEICFLFGKKNFFSLSAGYTMMTETYNFKKSSIEYYNSPVWGIGYRYQKPKGGLFLKGNILLFVPNNLDRYLPILFGIGAGYTFKMFKNENHL